MSVPSAIIQYKQKNHIDINKFLRNGTIPSGKTESDMMDVVNSISNAMSTRVPYPVLHRGTSPIEFGTRTVEALKKVFDQNQAARKATVFTWKGFTSTSTNAGQAARFATGSNKGVLLEIQINEENEIRFYDMSTNYNELKIYMKNLTNESEVLLDHHIRCKILSIAAITPQQPYTKVTVKILRMLRR